MSILRALTEFGFRFGAAVVERAFCDDAKGWVVVLVKTPKYPRGVQVYVTKTGKIRVFDDSGEWSPPAKKEGT